MRVASSRFRVFVTIADTGIFVRRSMRVEHPDIQESLLMASTPWPRNHSQRHQVWHPQIHSRFCEPRLHLSEVGD